MKGKRLLAGIISAAMVLCTMAFPAFAEDSKPDMSGEIINVTNANAQDVLDGKYGDVTGKTINFTESITDILDLARPTAYKESNTKYFNNSGSTSNEISWSEDVAAELNNIKTGTFHYYRTLENVTFTANEGVTVKGFNYNSNHIYAVNKDDTGKYDYVRGITLTYGQTSYYRHSSMKNITFKGLTFTYNFDALLYSSDCTVENITFDGCTFSGTDEYKNNTVAAIHMGADDQYFKNTVVKNCKIDKYFQGVYISGVDGAEITGNSISNTKHNALAFQSAENETTYIGNDLKGTLAVKENYLSNISNRAIRFNKISSAANIAINNNIMVNSGNSSGQLIAAESCADDSKVNLESNYWSGKDASTAVSNMTVIPATTGITDGVWNIDVSDYCASGYKAEQDETGKYTVKTASSAVAEVTGGKLNNESFSSLYDALEATNKDMFGNDSNSATSTDATVTLLKDTTESGLAIGKAFNKTGIPDSPNTFINNNVTLDLNKNTLTLSDDKKPTNYGGTDLNALLAVSNNTVIKNGTIKTDIKDLDRSLIHFDTVSTSGSNTITFENVTIEADSYLGAALYVTSGRLIFKNCTINIKNNSGKGTNIFDLEKIDKLILDNTNLYIDGGNTSRGITNTWVTSGDNSAHNTEIKNGSVVDIKNCKHALNHCGFDISDSTVNITNCSGNAISLDDNTTISNSTITIDKNSCGISFNNTDINLIIKNNSTVKVSNSTSKDIIGKGNVSVNDTSVLITDSSDIVVWTTDTDSGYYTDGTIQYGMMRFMFAAKPVGTVTASGIKYMKADDITAAPTVDGAVNTTKNSSIFQGDIVKIHEGTSGTYYARAYITTAENGTVWSAPVGCTVNWNQFFSDYTGGAE